MNKKFTPTPDMLRAAETLFVAMANLASIAPVVDAYQRDILLALNARPAARWADQLPDEPILNPAQAFLLGDDDFATYVDRCKRSRDAAGLKVEDDSKCPKLIAEGIVIEAKRALLKAMEPIHKLSAERTDSLKLADRDKLVELSLQMLAPFVGDANAVLGRFMADQDGGPATAGLTVQPDRASN